MPIRLSRYFGVDSKQLKKRGVLNAHIGIDNRLFVDPNLFKKIKLPEFQHARQDLEAYFSAVIKLLKASQKHNDVAWEAARKRLTVKEEHGAGLGYAGAGSFGKGVGPELAEIIAKRAKEILHLGIDDPEMFELIGLFQERFGPDLLSDMAVAILQTRFLSYTQRVTKELNLQPQKKVERNGDTWILPVHPDGHRPLVFVPAALLSRLPVALDRSEITEVAAFNEGVRRKWNAIVAAAGDDKRKVTKEKIRELLFEKPKNLSDLIAVYRKAAAQGYDFDTDPDGLLSWEFYGRAAAESNPLRISVTRPQNIAELRAIVNVMLEQFKKNIEDNKLYQVLYKENGRPREEVFAQRLFFATADTYCEANDVDLSREPNAGNGPVDFKLSSGYKGRILVEVKKSTNSDLLHGFETQLPAYEKSEATHESIYLIVRVSEADSGIKNVLALREKSLEEQKKVPEVFVVDARKKTSASRRGKRRRDR